MTDLADTVELDQRVGAVAGMDRDQRADVRDVVSPTLATAGTGARTCIRGQGRRAARRGEIGGQRQVREQTG